MHESLMKQTDWIHWIWLRSFFSKEGKCARKEIALWMVRKSEKRKENRENPHLFGLIKEVRNGRFIVFFCLSPKSEI